jgi:hypothetical protein
MPRIEKTQKKKKKKKRKKPEKEKGPYTKTVKEFQRSLAPTLSLSSIVPYTADRPQIPRLVEKI